MKCKSLKHYFNQLQLNKVITYQQLIISSFNHHALIYTKKYLPAVATAALIACCPVDYAKFCKELDVKMLNLAIDFINPEIINDAHSKGLQVWVYTVDNPAQIKQCLQYQVDGIFTNFPHVHATSFHNLNNTIPLLLFFINNKLKQLEDYYCSFIRRKIG